MNEDFEDSEGWEFETFVKGDHDFSIGRSLKLKDGLSLKYNTIVFHLSYSFMGRFRCYI